MSIKVFVNGAKGRMGTEVVKAIQADPQLILAGEGNLGDDLLAAIELSKAQVVVDFTLPDSVFENCQTIIAASAHPVIGTTGLTATQIETLQVECREKKLGGLIAPNFSISMVLMMQFAKKAAAYLPDVEIIEYHHDKKVDAPSGTAIKTAEVIAQGRQTIPEYKASQENIKHSRGGRHRDINIHAVRLPGIVANQDIIFGGHSETLLLRHESIHRQAFMPGVCLACKNVLQLDHLAYGLEHLL